MDENFDKGTPVENDKVDIDNKEINNISGGTNVPFESHVDDNIKTYSMDKSGSIHNDKTGAAAVSPNTRTFIILGWISAALTAFISAYFAIAGVTFGVLANRKVKGSGNIVIITNVVLAGINLIFGLVLFWKLRRAGGF
jgi:hypothetical protein